MSRAKKSILFSLIAIVIALAVFFAFLPTILSSDFGKNLITGKNLSIDELSLSWTEGQSLKGLRYKEEGLEVAVAAIESDCSFWNLLFRSGNAGKTTITNPILRVDPEKKRTEKKGKTWSDFKGELIVKNGRAIAKNVTIDGIHINFKKGEVFSFFAEGKTADGGFSLQGKEGFEGKGTITRLPLKGVDELVSIFYPQHRGLLLEIFGNTLDANFVSKKRGEGVDITLSVNSPLLQTSLEANYDNKLLKLNQPMNLTWTPGLQLYLKSASVNPKKLLTFKGEGNFSYRKAPLIERLEGSFSMADLKQKLVLSGQVYHFAFDKVPVTLSLLTKQGKIPELKLISLPNRLPLNFRDVGIGFDLEKKYFSLEGKAIPSGEVAFAVDEEALKISLKDVSSQVADAFLKTRGQLPDMIGPTLDLKYEKRGNTIDLDVDSANLFLTGAFVQGKTLELRSPLKATWKVSEKSYDALRRWRNPNVPLTPNDPFFEIAGAGELKVEVSSLSYLSSLYDSTFDAHLQLKKLKLKKGGTDAHAELRRFDFEVEKKEAIDFQFDGNVAIEGIRKSGEISGKGQFSGKLGTGNVTTSIEAKISHLPSIFIDILQPSEYPPSAFLGDLFDATFDAEIKQSEGTVNMEISASACRASFAGRVSQGILYLAKPLQALFTITPQLNDVLDKSAKLVVVAMEKPISLYIDPKGFNVPLKNLHIRNMSFQYGQLDMGQIICQNSGSASEVSGILKMADSSTVSIWFAPAEFNMKRGNVYLDRTEILYDRRYEVCLWGDVLFPRHYVDMTLGITAPVLRSFGIKGIDDSYVLKVPVNGPFGNVEVDTGAATAKIAFLVARKQIAPKAGIWGQVLGAVGDLADNQSDVPPPKPPFPWHK